MATAGHADGSRQPGALIIGAGPAGLAVARCLQVRNVPFDIVERGPAVGESWRHHYRRLHLHTVRTQSHLPDRPMPRDWPRYVSRQQVVDYLDDYARAFGIEPTFGCEVTSVERRDGLWTASLDSGGSIAAAAVVIASGLNRSPQWPDWPGLRSTAIPVMHSREYRNADPFAGERVLVVGMGNTGAEIALDLAEHGARATVSVRGPVNIVYRDTLGRPIQLTAIALEKLPGAVAGQIGWLLQRLSVGRLDRWGIQRPSMSPRAYIQQTGRAPTLDVGTIARIKRGEIDVRPGISEIQERRVTFADGRSEPFDRIILATGYQSGLGDLMPALRSRLGAGGQVSNLWFDDAPGLDGVYLAGFRPYDTGGLLRRIRLDAPVIARHIADHV